MPQPVFITIRLPVETRKSENGVIARCRFLDVSCVRDATDEALNDLAIALKRYFGSCFDLGRFDQLFHCNGYSAIEEDSGPCDGRFLDIQLKLATPNQEHLTQEQPRFVPASLLSTWMT